RPLENHFTKQVGSQAIGVSMAGMSNSALFNTEIMDNRPAVGKVLAKSRLRDRIDAIIAHEDAESLTGDHDLAEATAPDTTLPITDGARQILRAIRGNPREQ